MKLKALSASVALAVGMGLAVTAAAAPVFYGGAGTRFEDDSLDYFIDRGDGAGGAPNGFIDVGDSIVAVFTVSETSSVDPSGQNNPIPFEFAGIVDQFVVGKVTVAPGVFNFSFGANPGGFLDADGVAGGALIAGAPAVAATGATPGTVALMWDGGALATNLVAPDCSPAAGVQADRTSCITSASDGTLFWNVGFTGAGGLPVGNEHLTVSGATDDPLLVLLVGSSAPAGAAAFAFQQLMGGIGPDVLPQLCSSITSCPSFLNPVLLVDFQGSGPVQGGKGLPGTKAGVLAGTDPFARDDFQFEVVTVPEPGSLALLGLALAGFGVAARRRKSSV